MKPPKILENVPDATALDSSKGTVYQMRCDGILVITGTFPSGALDISFDMGHSYLPLYSGFTFLVDAKRKYRVRNALGATGTLQIVVLPVDSPNELIAQSNVALTMTNSIAEWSIPVSAQDESSANAAVTIDIAAGGAGTKIQVLSWKVTFEGNTIQADADIQILDGAGGTILDDDILGIGESTGTPHYNPPGFLVECSEDTLARLSIGAGGASVITHGTITGRYVPV